MKRLALESLLILGSLAAVVFTFRRVWTSRSALRSWTIRLCTSLFALLLCFLVLEVMAYQFLVVSDGFVFTLASRRWVQEHWHPINSLGYRDLEHDPAAIRGKRVLFVAGDSFTAGNGVDDYRDRYSGVLADELGDGWAVVTLAHSGWETVKEFEAIRDHPLEPEAIVLQHFVNDIEGAARRVGLSKPPMVTEPPLVLRPFVKVSYLVNFLYWRLYRFRHGPDLGEHWTGWMRQCWESDAAWQRHSEELLEIGRYAKDRGIRLVVLVVPHLWDIEGTAGYTSRVAALMRENQIGVVDLTGRLAGRDPLEMGVNRLDPHFGVALHAEVGRLLYEYLRALLDPAAPAPPPRDT